MTIPIACSIVAWHLGDMETTNIYQIAFRALFADAADCMAYEAELLELPAQDYLPHVRPLVAKLLTWAELTPAQTSAWYRWALRAYERRFGGVVIAEGEGVLALHAALPEIPLYLHERALAAGTLPGVTRAAGTLPGVTIADALGLAPIAGRVLTRGEAERLVLEEPELLWTAFVREDVLDDQDEVEDPITVELPAMRASAG
jgi:hypothetical protein